MAVVAVPREPTWASPGSALEEPRRWWMDNLRVAVIAAVIVAHVATAYVVDYDWYYEEKPANAVTEVVLTVVFGPGVLFAMGGRSHTQIAVEPSDAHLPGPGYRSTRREIGRSGAVASFAVRRPVGIHGC